MLPSDLLFTLNYMPALVKSSIITSRSFTTLAEVMIWRRLSFAHQSPPFPLRCYYLQSPLSCHAIAALELAHAKMHANALINSVANHRFGNGLFLHLI